MGNSKRLSILFLAVSVTVFSSCSRWSLTGSNGEYAIRITNPVITVDSSSFPYTHNDLNYENYSARYTVELYQPYNIRSLYRDLVSCKNPVPLKLALNEMFTPARKNKLPEKIITRFDMNETPCFVRTNKDGSQIMIPYSLMVSYDDIGNMDDIVFPPVQLQDSLFLTKKVGRMSFGYPVYMDDSIDMEKEYILELTRDEAKTYEYRGILKKKRLRT